MLWFYNQSKYGVADSKKKIKIIHTAVMLIQNDVQAVASDGTMYPSAANMSSTAYYAYLIL